MDEWVVSEAQSETHINNCFIHCDRNKQRQGINQCQTGTGDNFNIIVIKDGSG